MENTINGIHHITAIAGDAKRNYDFYTRILGLRMVKKTVNFDDPNTCCSTNLYPKISVRIFAVSSILLLVIVIW